MVFEFLVQESSTKGACADLVLEATAVGYIKATVGYKVERLELQAVQVIAAYSPLKVCLKNISFLLQSA